jgi:hypothetical protein
MSGNVSETGTSPAQLVEQLIVLTERLDARLKAELAAFEAHRPHEVAASVGETQRLAEAYRRESAAAKADPTRIAAAPLARRKKLIEATKAFEATVERHQAAVQAARQITEGLVKTIAGVVADARKPAAGYGPSAHAAPGDARAIALNKRR